MLRTSVFAFLCLAAAPAVAQTAPATEAPAGPPPAEMAAVQQAGMAFGQCVQTGVGAVPATVTPEAGAATVIAGCATQRTALEQAAQALLATVPEANRAAAQTQIRSQLDAIPAQVAEGIRQTRSAGAAPAAAPAATPAH